MKKMTILFLVIFLAGGVVMAQIPGLSLGGELGILDDFGDYMDLGDRIYVRPMVSYENNSLVQGLELYAEMGTPFWFAPKFWLGFDLDLKVGYGLYLSPISRLNFGLESLILIPVNNNRQAVYTPLAEKIDPLMAQYFAAVDPISWLIPSIRFTQGFDFGEIYGEITMPFLLVEKFLDPFDIFYFNITGGIETPMGLGASLTISNAFFDYTDNELFYSLGLKVYYNSGPLYAGMGMLIPTYEDRMKYWGMIFTPEFAYDVRSNLSIFGKLPIYGFLAKTTEGGRKLSMGMVFGVKYSL